MTELPEPLVRSRRVFAPCVWRHHFHGDYWAQVGAVFDSLSDANAFYEFARKVCDRITRRVTEEGKFGVVLKIVPSDNEDTTVEYLEQHRVPLRGSWESGTLRWCLRCERKHSIGDTAHSIDWGTDFNIEFDAPYIDAPGQRMLPLVEHQ